MQHNALHGAENRNYSKNQDSPSAISQPPTATANLAISIEPEPDTISTEELIASTPPIENTSVPSDFDANDEIVHTETFDVPFLPTANMDQSAPATTLREDFDLDELIFNPTQYLSYSN